jgi:hypothetical protein
MHYFQVITQSMSNLPKNIENELQRFIKILVLGTSWLRPQVEEQTIHVKVKESLQGKVQQICLLSLDRTICRCPRSHPKS